MKIPIHLAMSAVGATLMDADLAPSALQFSTDTRTLQPGDVFVALRGDNYNGHDYTAKAIEAGASMLVVDEPEARIKGFPTMLVDRTQRAYMGFASVARELFKGRVIAITGSAGKTTTKAFLTQLLAGVYGTRVVAAPGNENNEIGVSRLLLSASNEEHDVIVVEMGARKPGDIAALVGITHPHVGILTNVGDAHVEIMGSREKLAETKWALFGRGAQAVLNADDEVSVKSAPSLERPPHWFLTRDAGASIEPNGATTALLGRDALVEVRDGATNRWTVDVRVPGAHNRANIAAALAGASELGVDLAALVSLIPNLKLPTGRFKAFDMRGGWRLIYDAYNANAAGTTAALDALAQEDAHRRIAILGSMAELGDESNTLHERVGRHAASRVDLLLVGGEYAGALARGAGAAGMNANAIVPFDDNAQAAAWLSEHARSGDVVLLKASRKYKMEEIFEALSR
jgi:UDP-N-acetylmuramoyl-tripeptide--D-alanyl-D-alanine ligase